MTTPDERDLAAERYTAGMRELWGRGDYSDLAERLAPAAAALVEHSAGAGLRVLDLAAGTGNVAVLAAARRVGRGVRPVPTDGASRP